MSNRLNFVASWSLIAMHDGGIGRRNSFLSAASRLVDWTLSARPGETFGGRKLFPRLLSSQQEGQCFRQSHVPLFSQKEMSRCEMEDDDWVLVLKFKGRGRVGISSLASAHDSAFRRPSKNASFLVDSALSPF